MVAGQRQVINNCAECGDYKCEKFEKFIKMATPVGDALKALRQK